MSASPEGVTLTFNGVPIEGITSIEYSPTVTVEPSELVTPATWSGSFEISQADSDRLRHVLGEGALGRYWHRREIIRRARDRRRGITRMTYNLSPRQRHLWCEVLGIDPASVADMAMSVVRERTP